MENRPPIHVAVVDDDESLCRSLGRLLRASEIQATTYLSAEAFLADTDHPAFHCLILDIQLGGMSGIELGRRLADDGTIAPFIFLTAHDEPETRANAEATGCAGFFRKTDPGSGMLQAIRQLAYLQLSRLISKP